MRNKKTLMMVEIAVMVAFAYLLSLFRVGEMPQGGSVSLQMLPLFVVALRWGGVPGLVAGLLFSGIKMMVDPYIVHPVQALLDYPLAFATVGLAGFFKEKPLAGITIGGLSRFFMHFLAGVVFFGEYAGPGQSVYAYSLLYNITYMGPETIIALLTAPLVLRRLSVAKEGLEFKNNIIEILSFVVPLASMALVVGVRDGIPFLNLISLGSWALLTIYHLVHAFRGFDLAKRGLLLVTVPPAVVYVMFRLIEVL
ncbi:MAG: energy-coupled thiamine transporter ThiT [Peptococcaceae bacterium]|nr:energy-coupled thiamine transporter ThiT [Peptococcaceae bacterium]